MSVTADVLDNKVNLDKIPKVEMSPALPSDHNPGQQKLGISL